MCQVPGVSQSGDFAWNTSRPPVKCPADPIQWSQAQQNWPFKRIMES
jgi:hypothetical protein